VNTVFAVCTAKRSDRDRTDEKTGRPINNNVITGVEGKELMECEREKGEGKDEKCL